MAHELSKVDFKRLKKQIRQLEPKPKISLAGTELQNAAKAMLEHTDHKFFVLTVGTPSSIGNVTVLKCQYCDWQKDVTDYDLW